VHAWNTACLPAQVIAFFNAAGLPLPDDHMEASSAAGPASFGAEQTSIRRVTNSSPAWIGFPGTWGEFQILHALTTTQISGFSPVGPAQHDVWDDPIGTVTAWSGG
jgi:hypothetical protein